MTRYINKMSRTARAKAAENGHLITRMKRVNSGKWRGACERCGMFAFMLLMPEPGQERYFGQAINEICDA